MVIKRDHYVNQVLAKRWNGKVKIITGLRRCGKSYLLSVLYKEALLLEGVSESDIILGKLLDAYLLAKAT